MVWSKSYGKLFEWGLAVLAFSMLAVPRLVGAVSILFLILWVLGLVKRQLVFRFHLINSFIVLLYLAYLIGVWYTQQPELAFKYLEYKLVLLIFPLIFSFVPIKISGLRIPAIGFLAGITFVGGAGLFHSFVQFSTTNSSLAFISSNFSFIHHPTYFSVFAAFGIALVFFCYHSKWKGFSLLTSILLVLLFIFFQFLAMSLAGLLFLLFFLGFILITYVWRKWGKMYFILTLFGVPVLLFFAIRTIPSIEIQLQTSYRYAVEYMNDPQAFILNKQTYVGGNETRLIMWTAAFLEFKEHPFGVGTGNIDSHLSARLVKLGQPAMAEKNYNPHNQFLQTGLEIGVFGLLIFVSIILYTLWLAWKYRSGLLLFLASSLAFNSLFESMLQRQSGIVFYTFWICLIVAYVHQKNSVTNELT